MKALLRVKQQGELEKSKMAFLRTCVMVNLRWQLAGHRVPRYLVKHILMSLSKYFLEHLNQ